MSCRVFGVAHHSPEDVVTALLKSRIAAKASEIGILPTLSRADTRFKYLLLLSTTDLTRNLSRFMKSDIHVFVFSNPIDLVTFHGICPIDFREVDDFSFEYFNLNISAIQKSVPTVIRRIRNNFLPRLIDSVKHGSLLNPLMTFIYSLSSANQNTVKSAAIRHLYFGHSVQKLSDAVSLCLTERATDKLISILDTSVGKSYAVALQKVKEEKKKRHVVDFDTIAKETSTSSYELSYMTSVIDDVKEKYTDSFDKAKNRKTTGRQQKRKT